MSRELWGGEESSLTVGEVIEKARAAYEDRITKLGQPEALTFTPFDKMWEHQAANSGVGLLSGDSLGQISIRHVERWAETQALFTLAAYHQHKMQSVHRRAMTELAALFYDIGDELGVKDDTASAIDPAAGLMRRAVRPDPAAVDRPSTRIVRGTP